MAEAVIIVPDRVGKRDDVAKIGADVSEELAQQRQGGTSQDDEGHQDDHKNHVDFGQDLDAAVKATQHRDQCHQGNDNDQDDLSRCRNLDPGDIA